jgi:hypothetical protein
MRPCPSCGCHVREASARCPHCASAPTAPVGRAAIVALLGLTLAAGGCPEPQSDYGVAVTDHSETEDTGDTAAPQ